MKKKLLLAFLFSVNLMVVAQVTIGVSEEPLSGALLQLKDIKGDNAINSTKGLGLPRVDIIETRPKLGEMAESIGNSASVSWDEAAHIGLVVYNTNEGCTTETRRYVYKGVYVWNGSYWELLRAGGGASANDPVQETNTTLTDRDGNVYSIAQFGSAGVWMTQNLRTKSLPDDELVQGTGYSSGDSYEKKYYMYPQKDGAAQIFDPTPPSYWKEEYGLLYNWQAATNGRNCVLYNIDQGQATALGQSPGLYEVETVEERYIQGVCPRGWHLPSDREWNALEAELLANAENNATNPTGKYVEPLTPNWVLTAGPRVWSSIEVYPKAAGGFRGHHGRFMRAKADALGPNTINTVVGVNDGWSKPHTDGGLFVLLTGGIDNDGASKNYDNHAQFWTSSSASGTINAKVAWIHQVENATFGMGRIKEPRNKLYSIRCKKDD